MAFAGAMVPYLGFNAYFLLGPGRGVFTGWLVSLYFSFMLFFLDLREADAGDFSGLISWGMSSFVEGVCGV